MFLDILLPHDENLIQETSKVMIYAEARINTLDSYINSKCQKLLLAMGRFFTTHPGGRDNKSDEIQDLNLVKASHSKIFTLVWVVLY